MTGAGECGAAGLAPDELVDLVARLRLLIGRVGGGLGTATAAALPGEDGGRR